MPLLKLKTKQAIVVIGDLLARGRGMREGVGKKWKLGAKELENGKTWGEVREERIRR
jgi:hypothetical protein